MTAKRRTPASKAASKKTTATKSAAKMAATSKSQGSRPATAARTAMAVRPRVRGAAARAAAGLPPEAKSYSHPGAGQVARPDVGLQSAFKKKKEPKAYRFDSSLSPALDWDTNPARERGEALLERIRNAASIEEAKAAAAELARMSRPFLNWTGKAERLSFDAPTLPLFVHERLSTRAIIESLRTHRLDQRAGGQIGFDLFGDEQMSIRDRQLRAYEHRGGWTNRMILGDSAIVMNSLLEYEGMRESVQMIFMDPPYGVKFGSNFQPFVRKREVKHNDDGDLTREPEMVQAYRDTWELGVHSYLTYLRDRFIVARDLLTPSGSIFVQIGDDNLHHVRELLDELFGAENFMALITFVKTASATSVYLPGTADYVLWYAKDVSRVKYRQLFLNKAAGGEGASKYTNVQLPDGTRRPMTAEEKLSPETLPPGSRIYRLDNLTSQSQGRDKGEGAACWFPIEVNGKKFLPSAQARWKTNEAGMARLITAGRVEPEGTRASYVRFLDDFPLYALNNVWTDIGGIQSRSDPKIYVVQTSTTCIQRCMLMTTDPGDLVLDPTCGSGTTAYVAEQWGRRWITIDTSRVPLALARQRLLTSTFPWYALSDERRGPAAGFVYQRRRNTRGEEVGGLVPHVTLKSIATGEVPQEEVVVDRPEVASGVIRVAGPFCVEATIPTPVDLDGDGVNDGETSSSANHAAFTDRLIEVLRRAGTLYVAGGTPVTLHDVRPPAKSLALAAEAFVDSKKPVALVFGPEHGAVSEKLVYNAAREASAKRYEHLYVLGFAIEPQARQYIEDCEALHSVAATYVQMTPDLMLGDLLKTTKASQIFSVAGQPDIDVRRVSKKRGTPEQFEVELLGLDVFDPATLEARGMDADSVPMWMLDTDYNGLAFHAAQVFFPKTGAWDALKRALRATHDESVWDHLKGTVSAPFEPGSNRTIAVKVIDDRGNELLVVRPLDSTR